MLHPTHMPSKRQLCHSSQRNNRQWGVTADVIVGNTAVVSEETARAAAVNAAVDGATLRDAMVFDAIVHRVARNKGFAVRCCNSVATHMLRCTACTEQVAQCCQDARATKNSICHVPCCHHVFAACDVKKQRSVSAPESSERLQSQTILDLTHYMDAEFDRSTLLPRVTACSHSQHCIWHLMLPDYGWTSQGEPPLSF